MAKLSIKSVLSNVQILFFTLRNGKFVGEDEEGNKYYKAKPRKGKNLERRWVIYKNDVEASAVPAEWHGWLHHQTNYIPKANDKENPYRQSFIKEHIPNKTGTKEAYFPKGHENSDAKRDKATGDYEAWSPN